MKQSQAWRRGSKKEQKSEPLAPGSSEDLVPPSTRDRLVEMARRRKDLAILDEAAEAQNDMVRYDRTPISEREENSGECVAE